MTQVLQTTTSAIRQTMARPTLKVVVNKGLCRGSLSGAADWSRAVTSHGDTEQRPEPVADLGDNWAAAGRTAAPGK